MATLLQQLQSDPEFNRLPVSDRIAIASEADAEFGSLPTADKQQLIETQYTPSDLGKLDVPKWGRDNPNTYAATMTALDMSPGLAALVPGWWSVPVAGAISGAAGETKRRLNEEQTTPMDVARDVVFGSTVDAAGKGIGSLISKAKPISNWLVDKALKFSTSPNILPPAERAAIRDTYFKYNLSPNEAGWLKLKSLIDGYSSEAEQAIADATRRGVMIHPNEAIQKGSLPDLLRIGAEREGSSPGYTQTVKDTVMDFANQGRRTPFGMNEEKKQLQSMVADAFGSNTKSLPQVETRKRLAAGARLAIEDNVPAVKELNAAQSELFDLAPNLARSIGRLANRDPISLKETLLLPDAMEKLPGASGWKDMAIAAATNPWVMNTTAKGIRKIDNIAGKVSSPVRNATRSSLETLINLGRSRSEGWR